VFVSAIAPDGLAALRGALRARAERAFPLVALNVPADDGSLLARLYKMADVVDVASDGGAEDGGSGSLRVTARVPGWLMPELAPYRAP
jgi:50S ribosomal subunit-associated GTPase HflX